MPAECTVLGLISHRTKVICHDARILRSRNQMRLLLRDIRTTRMEPNVPYTVELSGSTASLKRYRKESVGLFEHGGGSIFSKASGSNS